MALSGKQIIEELTLRDHAGDRVGIIKASDIESFRISTRG